MTHQDPYEGMVNQMKDNAELVNYPPKIYDPYEAQGKNFRVNHPTQPKTQVERWILEKGDNYSAIQGCGCKETLSSLPMGYRLYLKCPKKGSFSCGERIKKIVELEALIQADHEKNKTYLNRHPVGTFADDKQ